MKEVSHEEMGDVHIRADDGWDQGGGRGGRKGAGVSRSNFESRPNRIGDWLKVGCGEEGRVKNEGLSCHRKIGGGGIKLRMRNIPAGYPACLEVGSDVVGGRLLSRESLCKGDPWGLA